MSAASGDSMVNSWLAWYAWLAQMASASRSPFGAFNLNEPILPNGTFAGIVINENNSSDPRMEHAILGKESYGRQLGRLMDAVAVLVSERPADAKPSAELDEFKRLKHSIDEIKDRTSRERFERCKTDLEWLKRNAASEYRARIDELEALIARLA